MDDYSRDHFEFTRNSKLAQWQFSDKRARPEAFVWIIVFGAVAAIVSILVCNSLP